MVWLSTNDKEIFPGYCMVTIQHVFPHWRRQCTFDSFTCPRSYTLVFWNPNLYISVGFTVIGSCAASELKFIEKVRLQGFRNTIFKSEIILESVTCLKIIWSLQNFKRRYICSVSFWWCWKYFLNMVTIL